jgi:hypothetical protein
MQLKRMGIVANADLTKRSPWVSYLGLMLSTFIMIEATAFQIPALHYQPDV